jgi:hypothetical protein
LDAYRRRYVAQAAGFRNESASDLSEDEPHPRCHSIAEEQAEGEGEMMQLSELQYPHWLMVAGVVLVVLGFIGFAFPRKRNIESDHGPTVNGK